MTCQQLRRYFEDPSWLDDESSVDADHLALCSACASFVETRHELRAGLRAIRESTPQCPGKLDDVVLARYRWHVANRPLSVNSNSRRFGLARLAWSAGAALLVVGTLFFVGGGRKDTAVRPQSPVDQPSTPRSVMPIEVESVAPWAKPNHRNSVRRRRPSHSVRELERPEWSSFRSLMYCDDLSCGGAMQLIRVQLPSSGMAFTPSSAAASGPVLADVLVGPDGVARGIRVVE